LSKIYIQETGLKKQQDIQSSTLFFFVSRSNQTPGSEDQPDYAIDKGVGM